MKKSLLVLMVSLCFASNANAHVHVHSHLTHHKYHKDIIPAFSAKSYLIADDDGNIIKQQDSTIVRPIASISKLMVALLISDQDLSEELEIPQKRTVQSSIPYHIQTLTRRELLTLALVKSDNFAAQILCNNLENCVDKMNSKAQELGMTNTHYVEPTGLSQENVSTAEDLLKLIIAAASRATICEISRMPKAEIFVQHKTIKINNTNPLTAKLNILLSKTGYTVPAGGCMVIMVESEIGRRIYILLGSKNAHTRIPDMERLIARS